MNKATRLRFKRALDIIHTGSLESYPEKKRTPALIRAVARCFERNRRWRRAAGVQGMGLSYRQKKGRTLRAPRLMVYVEKKVGRRRLAHPVPRRLTIPGLGTFATDVVAVGQIEWHAFTGVSRPLASGCQLTVGNEEGTLGALVESTDPALAGRRFLLTAAHVLTRGFADQGGIKVFQPSRSDSPDGHSAAGPGLLVKIEPAVFPGLESNPHPIDAGIAELDPAVKTVPDIRLAGVQPVRGGEVGQGDTVRMIGAASDAVLSGDAFDLHLAPDMIFTDPVSGAPRKAYFKDLVLARYKGQEGDSGALVLNSKDEVVGLHMGGARGSGFGIFCRIGTVLDTLKIKFIPRPT